MGNDAIVKANSGEIVQTPASAPARALARTQFGKMITDFDAAWRMASALAKSDLVPKDFKDKPANCLIAMQFGAEIGLSPMASLRGIAVIGGRPGLWGDALLGVIMKHPDYEDHKEEVTGQGDDRKGVFSIKRRGKDWYTVEFSVKDAKVAKLWQKKGREGQDTPWVTYPDRMLKLRARGFAIRDKFADALCGLGMAEELQDYPPDEPRNVIESRRMGDATDNALAELAGKYSSSPESVTAEEETTADPIQAQESAQTSAPTNEGTRQTTEPPSQPNKTEKQKVSAVNETDEDEHMSPDMLDFGAK